MRHLAHSDYKGYKKANWIICTKFYTDLRISASHDFFFVFLTVKKIHIYLLMVLIHGLLIKKEKWIRRRFLKKFACFLHPLSSNSTYDACTPEKILSW